MALEIQDITIWILGLSVFNYLLIYRRNSFFGSIGYIAIAGLMFALRTEFGYTEVVYGWIAFFILMGAIVNLVYEMIGTFDKRNKL